MQNINEIDDLIKLISKLPGLGPKSAKRIVLKLINNKDEIVKPLANTLAQVYKKVVVKHKRYKRYPAKGTHVLYVNSAKRIKHNKGVFYHANEN